MAWSPFTLTLMVLGPASQGGVIQRISLPLIKIDFVRALPKKHATSSVNRNPFPQMDTYEPPKVDPNIGELYDIDTIQRISIVAEVMCS